MLFDAQRSYNREFEAYIRNKHPQITCANDVWKTYDKSFPAWLRDQVSYTDFCLNKPLKCNF